MEHIGGELAQTKSSKESPLLQNGYSHEPQEELSDILPGSVVDPHQRLLIVLSNIGYCKDELSYELYNKYSGSIEAKIREDQLILTISKDPTSVKRHPILCIP